MSDYQLAWEDIRDPLAHNVGSDPHQWFWGSAQKLDLRYLYVTFAEHAPARLRIQICPRHVAIHIFDDILYVGMSQLTEESWTCLHGMREASQEGALSKLALTANLVVEGRDQKGAADVSALH